MNGARILVVNADDFGLSPGVNAGVARAHEQGILTSASLMVRWPAAAEAAAYAKLHPLLSVGLHLDLGEWTFEAGEWRQAYEVIPLNDSQIVAAEIAKQLTQFRMLLGRDPTHLDSHQHVHESEPMLSLCRQIAQQSRIPLRKVDPRVNYCGSFYGQSNKGYPYPEGISVGALVAVLKKLPSGITELGCHPAQIADMKGMYRDERMMECATLCDAAVKVTLQSENIALRSFNDWQD
jgi:predicted glycoside hydrolase/deacetylase ChbG (UPF0249 family)